MSAGDGKPLLTYDDVAALLSVSPSTVERLVRRGELPSVKIGTKIRRIRRVDLDRYVTELGGEDPAPPVPATFLAALPPLRRRRS